MAVPQMTRADVGLNVAFVVLITALVCTLAMAVFGIDSGVAPPWAKG